jgi:hypothetical protein
MQKHILKTAIIALITVVAAMPTQAQGRGNGKGKEKPKRADEQGHGAVVTSNGEVIVPAQAQATKIPPGLAKKPGQMPPGQYKKHYTVTQGSSVLSQILGQNGYTVQRVVTSGSSRYVYYLGTDGLVHRAIVSPGTTQLGFSNVPASLLQLVLNRLY